MSQSSPRSEKNDRSYRRMVNSWSMYDWANSAYATTILAVVLPVYYSQVAGADLPGNTATVFWGYTHTIALLIVALLAPVLGTMADLCGIKKRLLLGAAALGTVFTACLYMVRTGDWFIASFFFIISFIGYAAADLFYNSLLPHVAHQEDLDRVSTRGYAFGYLGGGLLLALNVVMIMTMSDKEWAQRLSFLSVAVWWALFTLPLIVNIPEPTCPHERVRSEYLIRASFRQLKQTFMHIRRYNQLLLFLIAFWIYNDGIGTIIKMASIYAREIGLSIDTIIAALLLTQFVGIPCSFAFGRLARRIGTKNSIYLGLIIYTFIAMGGYFMSRPGHFWLLAALVGLVQGGTQALSRSLFAAMSPKAHSAEFFGFYGMSSKFAGIVGPFVFAVVGQMSGSSRLSIVVLVVFFIGGGLLLSQVDVDQGILVAREDDACPEKQA
ncbi:MFS transporter [bacterium]|nr:MFS transporter [bacterium]